MSFDPVELGRLVLDLSGLTDQEINARGQEIYGHEFLAANQNSGSITAHDGKAVVFFRDRYHHAFHTSFDRAQQAYSKARLAVERIERIRWIKPIIEGRVAEVECWEVPLKVPEEGIRRFPGKRLYVSWREHYLIWLEPLKGEKLKFSSAYLTSASDIARYTTRANKIWTSAG